MARSTRIYVVMDSGNEPLAAFTVKWECISWLREHQMENGFNQWWVTSFKDGTSQKVHDSTGVGMALALIEFNRPVEGAS